MPIVTASGYEADDVIGTMAKRAAEGGFDVAIVSIDKDFFQLVARRRPRLRPARGRRLVRRGGVRREVRRQAIAGRRRARARRRHERQRRRRAGCRQEGRHRPHHHVRQPRCPARPRPATSHSASTGSRLLAHRDDALRSRELVTIKCDVPIDVDVRGAALSRRLARTVLRALLPPGVPDARRRLRADSRHHPEGLRAGRARCPSSTRCISELRAAGEFACGSFPINPSAMRAGDRRHRVLDRRPARHVTSRWVTGAPDGGRSAVSRHESRRRSTARRRSTGSGRSSRTGRSGRSATT